MILEDLYRGKYIPSEHISARSDHEEFEQLQEAILAALPEDKKELMTAFQNSFISIQQLRADMIVAIHAAATSENQETRQRLNKRFHGVEPSPEEFISAIATDLTLPYDVAPFTS